MTHPAQAGWPGRRAAFAEAAHWFVATTTGAGDRWHERGLGEWTVRDLVGHTSRALLTVEAYLAQPAPAVEVDSAVGYFRRVSAAAGDPAAVAERGRQAGAALGDRPADAVAAIAERVLARVDAADGTEMVTTAAGGMRLADYLPTRTFELVVHTCDLAAATDQPLRVPAAAAAETVGLAGLLAVDAGHAGPLLLAVTGRRGLPGGFTVL